MSMNLTSGDLHAIYRAVANLGEIDDLEVKEIVVAGHTIFLKREEDLKTPPKTYIYRVIGISNQKHRTNSTRGGGILSP